MQKSIKIACISDTHNRTVTVPEVDLLLHAGDFTSTGSARQVILALDNIKHLSKSTKFAIPGNHELCSEQNPSKEISLFAQYGWELLINQLTTFNDLVIFGSPIQPNFCNWAWNRDVQERKDFWKTAPKCDILISHGPAYGLLDECEDGRRVGCQYLLEYIDTVKPRLVVCGHIHHSYGTMNYGSSLIVNASTCNEKYQAVNPPIIITYDNVSKVFTKEI